MLEMIAASRPVFDAGRKALTFTVPDAATRGDLLLIVAASDAADSHAIPDGWDELAIHAGAAGAARITILGRMIDAGDPATVTLDLDLATHDWLGQIIAYAHGAPNVVIESFSAADFAADATPTAPGTTAQQAIDIDLRAWSAAGSLAITAPAGYAAIDAYSSATVAARSFLVAAKVANATGVLASADASASGAATGSGATFILCDSPPVAPVELVDLVPGNIGLLGKDNRPPREVP